MHQAVLQQARQHSATQVSASSKSSSSGRVSIPVVGIDLEWKPYERGAPKTPVALLQLATRDKVFLVDLLAICQQQQHQQQPVADAGSSSSSTDPGRSSGGVSQEGCVESGSAAARPAEEALALFLQQLFADPGIKCVGFGLRDDLQRLARSYPWLLHLGRAARDTASSPSDSNSSGSSAACKADGQHMPLQPAGSFNTQQTPRPATPPLDGTHTLVVHEQAALSLLGDAAAPAEQPAACWVVRQAVDLQQLDNGGHKAGPGSSGRRCNGQGGSLSRLVSRVLGRPLDKTQQASSWGARPLSEAQLVYAANDAHVLTVLYDALVSAGAAGA